jgi:Ca-activated chloride channel family protein
MLDLFEAPWALLLLLFVPAYGWLLYARRRRRSGPMIFSRVSLLRALPAGPRVWVSRALPALRLLAMALVILACARPSLPNEEVAEVEGLDIYVCLDLSGSMQAIDIEDKALSDYQKKGKEPPNRFVVAKEVLKEFVQSRSVDRIGMVVFARDAYLQFPMTIDYSTILTQLEQLQLGDIDGAGTAIGNALGRAVAGLRDPRAGDADEERTRLIILITDGDRRGGNISPQEAARFAQERGIKVFPILVGKEGKARVPVGRDLFSGRVTYRYQEYPVDPALLQEIADTTGGTFYRASDKEALSQNLHEILDSFERAAIEDAANVTRTPLFGPLAALAVLALVLELGLMTVVVRPFP